MEFSSFLAAGLKDGVGVCGFVGLVFFIALLGALCRGRLFLFLAGGTFLIVSFWTLVSVGLGVFSDLVVAQAFLLAARIVYLGIAVLAFVLGVFSFHDWLKGRGFLKTQRTLLSLPEFSPGAKSSAGGDENFLKLLMVGLGVMAAAGGAGFLLTILASLRVPQPYVAAMIYSLSVEKKIWEAVFGMMIYAAGYLFPILVVWMGSVLLRLFSAQKNISFNTPRSKIVISAVLFALSAGLLYAFV